MLKELCKKLYSPFTIDRCKKSVDPKGAFLCQNNLTADCFPCLSKRKVLHERNLFEIFAKRVEEESRPKRRAQPC